MSAITGRRGKLASRLAHSAPALATINASRIRNWVGAFSKYRSVLKSSTQPRICGLAVHSNAVVASMGTVKIKAKKKLPPHSQLSRNHSHVAIAIVTANNQTTAGRPARDSVNDMTQSDAQPHAISVRGTWRSPRIFSPVTICCPVFESRKNDRGALKKKMQ